MKALQKVEGGWNVKDMFLEYCICEVTYCNWRTKFVVMEAADIKRLRDLEDEKDA